MSNTFKWAQQGRQFEFVVGDESETPEITAFLSPTSQTNYVITGVGGRVHDHDVVMLQLTVRPINPDGTLGDASRLVFGDSSKSAEVNVTLGENQVAVGVGLRSASDNLTYVRVYYRTWDPDLGVLGAELHHESSSSSTSAELAWYIDDSEFSSDELETTVLTGVAATSSKNSDGHDQITVLSCTVGQVEYVMPSDELPAGGPANELERAVESYDPEVLPLMLALAPYADDAYRSIEDDAYFENPYDRVDGLDTTFGSKSNWQRELGYSLIEDSTYTGSDLTRKYWGVIGRFTYDGENGSQVHALVVAFRGTKTWSDLAIDFEGAGAGATLSLPNILSARTAFWASSWNVGGHNLIVHQGFHRTYQAIADSVRSQVVSQFQSDHALSELYIVGHSLGGALADLCAVDIVQNPPSSSATIPRPKVVTYAAPKVGDSAFVNVFDSSVASCHAASHTFDLVPYVPYWYDTSSIPPVITDSGLFANVAGAQVFRVNKWFPYAHNLRAYYDTIQGINPTPLGTTSLQGSDLVTSLKLTIHTASWFGAGTDADVYVTIGGVIWGPLDKSGYNDFEYNDTDTYDLFQMFPSRVPGNLFVNDLYGTEVVFYVTNVGYTDIYTYSWGLDWVDVIVNNQVLTRLQYQKWVNTPSEGLVAARIGYPQD